MSSSIPWLLAFTEAVQTVRELATKPGLHILWGGTSMCVVVEHAILDTSGRTIVFPSRSGSCREDVSNVTQTQCGHIVVLIGRSRTSIEREGLHTPESINVADAVKRYDDESENSIESITHTMESVIDGEMGVLGYSWTPRLVPNCEAEFEVNPDVGADTKDKIYEALTKFGVKPRFVPYRPFLME